MKECFKRCSLALMLLCTSVMNNVTVTHCDENVAENVCVGEFSADDVFTCAYNYAQKYIPTYEGLSTIGYASLDEGKEYYVGSGYFVYSDDNGEVVANNEVCFPVIQDNNIVLIVKVFCCDGELHGIATTSGCDVLNSYGYGDSTNVPCVVSNENGEFLIDGEDVVSLVENELYLDEFTSYQLSEFEYAYVEETTSSVYIVNELFELGFVESGLDLETINSTSSAVDGFDIYTDTYKILDMENCMVSQRWMDGTKKNLCWAATAATIIRYKTQKTNIWAYTISQEMGISPNSGATIDKIYKAMTLHMTTTQLDDYQVLDRCAKSITEVYHNINNRFPIAMGTVFDAIEGSVGHAVTIVGYNVSILIYWNSDTEALETVDYSYKTAVLLLDGNPYKWESSVMIPL